MHRTTERESTKPRKSCSLRLNMQLSQTGARLSGHFPHSILLDDPKRAGLAAIVCGALAEYGADPAPMEEPLLARFLPALRKMAEEPVPELTPDVEPVPVQPPGKSQSAKRQKPPGLFMTLWRLLTSMHRVRR